MSEEEREIEEQTLGALLRDTRKKKNLSLDDAWEATKISKPVIEAMEADDYDSMPAVAFCRGFYVLYADFLNLDSESVLARYLKNKGLPPTASNDQAVPPISNSEKFSNYAERSAVSPRTSATILLTACFAVLVGVCWYFNWNPISYISNELPATQQTSPSALPQVAAEQAIEVATVTVEEQPPAPEEEIVQGAPYHIEMTFYSAGTMTVTQDNGFYINKQYEDGETMEWNVEESILLEMPEEIDASILLNGTELPLPAPVDGRRLLSLPADILN